MKEKNVRLVISIPPAQEILAEREVRFRKQANGKHYWKTLSDFYRHIIALGMREYLRSMQQAAENMQESGK